MRPTRLLYLLLLYIAVQFLTACAPFPTQQNQDAFNKGAEGTIHLDTSDLGGTQYKTIFSDAEPLLNASIHNDCFSQRTIAAPMDILQSSPHEWIGENIKSNADVVKYIRANTLTLKIEVNDDDSNVPENDAAYTTLTDTTITFSTKWMTTAPDMPTIVGVLTHEMMHSLGFDHFDDSRKGSSTPYTTEKIVQDFCFPAQ